MSVFGGKADIGRMWVNVRFWPKADMSGSRLLLCNRPLNPIPPAANPWC